MSDIFITSDEHYDHANIIKFIAISKPKAVTLDFKKIEEKTLAGQIDDNEQKAHIIKHQMALYEKEMAAKMSDAAFAEKIKKLQSYDSAQPLTVGIGQNATPHAWDITKEKLQALQDYMKLKDMQIAALGIQGVLSGVHKKPDPPNPPEPKRDKRAKPLKIATGRKFR